MCLLNSVCAKEQAQVWVDPSGLQVCFLTLRIPTCCFSYPTGFSSGHFGTIVLWDIQAVHCAPRQQPYTHFRGNTLNSQWNLLLSGHAQDCTVRIWLLTVTNQGTSILTTKAQLQDIFIAIANQSLSNCFVCTVHHYCYWIKNWMFENSLIF